MGWTVNCDVDRMKAVLVHAPGAEWELTVPWDEEHPSTPRDIINPEKARKEHGVFQTILKTGSDLQLFELEDLLQESLDTLSERELQELFSKFLKVEGIRTKIPFDVFSAHFILGKDKTFFFHFDEKKSFLPIILPKKWAIFTRDMAVMTPAGLVICSSWNFERNKEPFVMKVIFDYHPKLSKCIEIALNLSTYRDTRLEGGDLIVKDNETFILGTGNLSNEQAAKVLAEKLGILVLGVSMPSWNGTANTWSKLNRHFLHLDTLFGFVERDEVAAFPYIFREDYKPLASLFEGIANDMRRHGWRSSPALEEVPTKLKHLGRVTEFRADGSVKRTNKKLLDYLDIPEDKVTYVGGCRENYSSELEHAFVALREMRFQAANLLAREPGINVAYSGNENTLASLRTKYKLKIFTTSELMRCDGGPHCLALPLLRY